VVPAVLLGGVSIPGGPMAIVVLLACAVGVALASGLWGLGVVYRTRTQRTGGLVQVGIFMAMFLSVGLVPLTAMEGTWLWYVARINPTTQVLTAARSGFVGSITAAELLPAVVAFAVVFAGLGWFAWRGFCRLGRS
jgi:ABC-type multidrug transport system permease subunit